MKITKIPHKIYDFEFVKINEKFALDELYDTIPADLLETEIDTCWAKVAGVNPAAYVRQYTGRATILHLKDFAGGKTENMYELIGIEGDKPQYTKAFEFRPIGYGRQDIPTLLEAAEAAAKGAMDHGMKTVEVYVKGPGNGREAAIRALQAVGLEVSMIKDVTPIPHNGCRPRKRRRV